MFKNKLMGLSLAGGLFLTGAVASGAAAQERRPPPQSNGQQQGDRYDNRDGNLYRQAIERGYNDGLKQGAADVGKNRRSNAQNAKDYKKAGNGYNSRGGSKSAFQQAYREGFTRGYGEGFDRNRPHRPQ